MYLHIQYLHVHTNFRYMYIWPKSKGTLYIIGIGLILVCKSKVCITLHKSTHTLFTCTFEVDLMGLMTAQV